MISNTARSHWTALVCLPLGWVVASGAALGQSTAATAAEQASGLEEVVVTGTRRDTKFLEAPVSVSVFTEESLTKAGVTRPQDFLSLTPNVTFIQSNHAGEAFVNVRGQTSVRQSESAVAVVIDGVQLATQNEFNGELFDVQQIEVLKGPQGALYGRNAAAGAIIITTKAPTNSLEGKASASLGNWNTSKATLSVSGPLTSKLSVRGSVAVSNSDGPFTNVVTEEKSYRSDEKSARLRFDYRFSDNANADLRLGASRLSGGAIAANAQGPNIVNGGVSSPVDSNSFSSPYVTDVPGLNKQEKSNASLKLDFNVGAAKLTSVTAYNSINDEYQAKLFPYQSAFAPGNDPGNAILFGDQTQKYKIENKAYSQELRLSSTGEARLRWEAGLYYLDSTREFTTIQGFNGRVPLNANGTPNVGVSGYLPNPMGAVVGTLTPAISTAIFGAVFNRWDRLLQGGGAITPGFGISGLSTVNPTNSFDLTRYEARNYAPFGNVQFDITDTLEIGVALRYDVEKREVKTLTPLVTNPFTGASYNQCVALFNRPAASCTASEEFKQLQPKVSLTYKVPDRGSVFASWGRSFKSGGFNAIGSREVVVRATAVGSTRAIAESLVFLQDSYEKEIANASEIGFKSEWLDRRLSLNGAVFKTDIDNAQQFSFFPSGSIQAVSSIDRVDIVGAELEATGRVSDWLTLFAGYGYTDAEIKQFRAQPTSVGNKAPYVADYNYTVGFQADRSLANGATFNARLEFNQQGPVFFDTANTPGTRRDAVGLVNARVGISGESWEVALWSRNLTDEEYRSETVVLPTGLGIFNPGFKAATRSYGVEGKFSF